MWLQQHDPRHAGCIGFYHSSGSLIDEAIVLRTGSQIVHVAIFYGEHDTIAATSGGISKQNTAGDEFAVWTPQSGYEASRLNSALQWLNGQVGLPYGYADIANQILSLVGKNAILLDKSSDCSDLATKFLWIAGVALPNNFIEVHLVTPGGLYTALGQLN